MNERNPAHVGVEGMVRPLVERLREAGDDYTVAWGSGDLYDEAADEIERLRGEREVLVSVLRECDSVISTLEPQSTDEDEALQKLLGAIKRVTLLHQADERDLLSACVGPNVGIEPRR